MSRRRKYDVISTLRARRQYEILARWCRGVVKNSTISILMSWIARSAACSLLGILMPICTPYILPWPNANIVDAPRADKLTKIITRLLHGKFVIFSGGNLCSHGS